MKEIVVIDQLTQLGIHRRSKDLSVIDLRGPNQALNSLLDVAKTDVKNSKQVLHISRTPVPISTEDLICSPVIP